MQKNICQIPNLEVREKFPSTLHNTGREAQHQEIAISTPLETEVQEALEHLPQAKPVQCSTSTPTPLITSDIEENADWQSVLKKPAEDCQEEGTGINANQIPLTPHPATRPQNHQASALTPQMRLLSWIWESQSGPNYRPDPLTSEGSGQLVMKPEGNQDVEGNISTHDDLPLGATAGNYKIKKTYPDMISMTSHLVPTPKIKKQITPCRPDTILNQEETSKFYTANKAEENIKSPVPSLQRINPVYEETLYPNSTTKPEAEAIAEVKNLSKNIQEHLYLTERSTLYPAIETPPQNAFHPHEGKQIHPPWFLCGECHQILGYPSRHMEYQDITQTQVQNPYRANHSIRNYFAAQALPVVKVNPYYEQYQRMPQTESDDTTSISSMWSD